MAEVITLTREGLYDHVWSTPMRRLASEYGLSDVGLSKLCRRHDIPCPPVGYWAKKEAGKAPPPTPLPPSGTGEPEMIRIYKRPDGSASEESPPQYDDDILKLLERPSVAAAARARVIEEPPSTG